MSRITIAGLDIAKNVFQFHGINKSGEVLLKKRIRRGRMHAFFRQLPPCLIGIEACGGAHYWAQTLTAYGHEVRLMDARFVMPYVKGNKTDAADAEAICEAVQRPTMRFVPIKHPEQQQVLQWHRSRKQLMKQRIALGNHIRSVFYEMGIVFPRGSTALQRTIEQHIDAPSQPIHHHHLNVLWTQFTALQASIEAIETLIKEQVYLDDRARLLMRIPGIGVLSASALVATIGDASAFHNARQFAAYLGLTPKQHSSGNTTRMLGISKRGNTMLRTLLIHGSRAVYRHTTNQKDADSQWLTQLAQRRHHNVAIVALANKTARRAWTVLRRGTPWVQRPVAA